VINPSGGDEPAPAFGASSHAIRHSLRRDQYTSAMGPTCSNRGFLRPVVRLLIYLAIGLCANVAVAWSLAAWLPQRDWKAEIVTERGGFNNSFALFVTNYYTVGACRRVWDRDYFGETRISPFALAIENSRPTHNNFGSDSPSRGLRWGRAESVRTDPKKFAREGCEHATGWPFLTAWCEWSYDYSGTPQQPVLHRGIPMSSPAPGSLWPNASQLRALPLRPIWTGLVLNTVFYALAVWCLWQALSMSRRYRRRARGQCVRCGYSLAGLALPTVCPECGHL
jgi:hypothetical protein